MSAEKSRAQQSRWAHLGADINARRKAEARQLALFKRRMRRAAQDADLISDQGEGNCGLLVEELLNACKEVGLYNEPGPRQGYRKRKISNFLRTQVFERDSYRCVHCGTHKDLRADHVYPESAGGATTLDNLQTLCLRCNSVKGRSIPVGAPQ